MYCRSVYHKSLAFHCTLLVSNKSNFTHLFTLVCIPSYNLSPYWHPNKKSLKVLEGEKTFFRFGGGSVKRVKRGETKFSKVEERGTKRAEGDQDFSKKLKEVTDLHCERFFIQKSYNLSQIQNWIIPKKTSNIFTNYQLILPLRIFTKYIK